MTMQEMDTRLSNAEKHIDELMSITLSNSKLLGRIENLMEQSQKDQARHLENHAKYLDPKVEKMWEDKIERRGSWSFAKGGWGMGCAVGAGVAVVADIAIRIYEITHKL